MVSSKVLLLGGSITYCPTETQVPTCDPLRIALKAQQAARRSHSIIAVMTQINSRSIYSGEEIHNGIASGEEREAVWWIMKEFYIPAIIHPDTGLSKISTPEQ